ncbi:MAG: hypothetical protein ABEJ83_05330 [Candidatus Nanohaloarchaea archaeon]
MSDQVDKEMDRYQEENFPDWHGSSKRPYFEAVDEPMALMTYTKPVDDHPRSWSHLRRTALASPFGYGDGDLEGPMINWASHYFKPEQWEELKDQYDEDRFVVNMSLLARQNMLSEFKDYLQEDDETVVVNPMDMMDVFDSKYSTAQHLENSDLPGTPSVTAYDLLHEGQESVEAEIGDGGDYGFVVKPFNGYGGEGVEPFDTLDEVEEYLTEDLEDLVEQHGDEVYRKHIIQPKVPHDSDLRVVTVGDEIVNAERRFAPEEELCTNISSIDGVLNGQNLGVYGNAYKALKNDRVMPVNVDYFDEIPEISQEALTENDSLIGLGAEELSEDILNSFDPDEFNFDNNLPQRPFKIGIDLLEADRDEIDHLPDELIDTAEAYSDGDTVYLVPELNGNPGSMADLIARWSRMEEQMTPVHTYNLMKDLAGLETDPVGDILGDKENPAWKRIDEFYPDLNEKSTFVSRAARNTRDKR